jgi:carbon monoxide dehydrogenase subunit G
VRLENSFRVPARAEQAWELLNDVPRVIPCMPGAELTEVVGEDAWKAVMHVKLGPIALQFGTDITRAEIAASERRVVLEAKARELKGRGGAQARIESSLTEVDGETNVTIVTDLTLQGTVAQYGRGIVADVSAELTRQFAQCLAAKLDAGGDGAAPANGGAPAESVVAEPSPVKPIGGMRLGLAAIWHSLLGRFRRGS